MSQFTEARLEEVFIELLNNEGYTYLSGKDIKRAKDEVLIEDDLITYLANRYEPENLTNGEIDRIIRNLKSLAASDLYDSNKDIMKKVSDGFIFKREDRTKKDLYIQLIDYSGLSEFRQPDLGSLPVISEKETEEYNNKDQNIYKFVNQLEIESNHLRIPDGILYINGLPLVVFEFKSAIREEATIHDAYIQLTNRYQRDPRSI